MGNEDLAQEEHSSERSPESEAAQTVSKISLFAKEPETSASQSDSPQLECERSELNSTGMGWYEEELHNGRKF